MALLAYSNPYDPRTAPAFTGYVPGIGEREISPTVGAGSNFWYPDEAARLRIAGYPKIDLNKYKPVVAGDTAQAFEKGVQAPIKLR